jgi:hypothetical protein
MKIILRIIMILLVAAVVAGAFSLAVKNNLIASSSNDGGQPPSMTDSSGQTTTQQITRPEGGDRDSGSIAGGVGGILTTILKLTGITILVLVMQKIFGQLSSLKWKFAQH